MNIKGITVLGLGMSLVSSTLLAQENAFKPDFKALDAITVNDGRYLKWPGKYSKWYGNGPAWYGEFRSDGSAMLLKVDSDPRLGVAGSPRGSFSVKKIYSLVAPHLKRPPADKKEFLNVIFHFNCSSTNRRADVLFHIEDKQVMRTLMYGLRDKVVPLDRYRYSFENYLSEYPLVPGDEPTPFSYGWDEEGYRAAQKTFHGKVSSIFSPPIILTNKADRQDWKVPEFDKDGILPLYVTRGFVSPSIAIAIRTQFIAAQTEVASMPYPQAPSSRLWLYGGILAALCGGVALLLARKKK